MYQIIEPCKKYFWAQIFLWSEHTEWLGTYIDFMSDWEADTEIIAFYSDNEESKIDR